MDDAAGSCTDECTEVTVWLRLVPTQDRPNPGVEGRVGNCYLLGYEGSEFCNSVSPGEWSHSNIRPQIQHIWAVQIGSDGEKEIQTILNAL